MSEKRLSILSSIKEKLKSLDKKKEVEVEKVAETKNEFVDDFDYLPKFSNKDSAETSGQDFPNISNKTNDVDSVTEQSSHQDSGEDFGQDDIEGYEQEFDESSAENSQNKLNSPNSSEDEFDLDALIAEEEGLKVKTGLETNDANEKEANEDDDEIEDFDLDFNDEDLETKEKQEEDHEETAEEDDLDLDDVDLDDEEDEHDEEEDETEEHEEADSKTEEHEEEEHDEDEAEGEVEEHEEEHHDEEEEHDETADEDDLFADEDEEEGEVEEHEEEHHDEEEDETEEHEEEEHDETADEDEAEEQVEESLGGLVAETTNLLRPAAKEQVENSLQKLQAVNQMAESADNILHDSNLQGTIHKIIENKIETWLNNNLPSIVENIVASEIAKIIKK